MSTTAAELNHKQDVARARLADFNGLARIYRWMEWCSFGPFLWNCRCAFLDRLRLHRRALVLGDGDGRFAARLLQENSSVALDAVDASSAMLAELEDRAAANCARLRTHVADARSFLPPRRDYDLVITHFFLDCLTTEDVIRLATRLRKHVAENATWIISEFAVPPGWYGRAIARPLIAALYWAFGWLTGLEIRRLPSYRSALLRAGWRLQQERKWLGGLLISELWQAGPKQ
jgi:SAM-dependent methyltransferase